MALESRQGSRASERIDWRRAILDFLFPPRCVGCGTRGAWLCPGCRQALPRLPRDRCPLCGGPSHVAHAQPAARTPCPAWRRAGRALDGLFVDYAFEGTLRQAIHQLKYRGARHLAGPLAELLLETLAAAPEVDALVPVPLHPSRLRDRGYNQSALLSRELERRTGLPTLDGPLRRVRATASQMALSAARRQSNVAGAFAVSGPPLAVRRVLLVDDVCTTGSTLDACAAALKAAGCAEVWGLTLARVV